MFYCECDLDLGLRRSITGALLGAAFRNVFFDPESSAASKWHFGNFVAAIYFIGIL